MQHLLAKVYKFMGYFKAVLESFQLSFSSDGNKIIRTLLELEVNEESVMLLSKKLDEMKTL